MLEESQPFNKIDSKGELIAGVTLTITKDFTKTININ